MIYESSSVWLVSAHGRQCTVTALNRGRKEEDFRKHYQVVHVGQGWHSLVELVLLSEPIDRERSIYIGRVGAREESTRFLSISLPFSIVFFCGAGKPFCDLFGAESLRARQ